MHFLLIFGPPAVGKMTVGREIQKATGIRLFHNHMSIEPVLNFFPFGSPSFERIVGTFRRQVFEAVLKSDLPGLSFTYVWSLDTPGDNAFASAVCAQFRDAGASVALVELTAALDQRLQRNRSPERLTEKPSKRDISWSERHLLELDSTHRMNTSDGSPLAYSHLIVDTTHVSPARAAEIIIEQLNLPRLVVTPR